MSNYEKKKWLRRGWDASGLIADLQESYREVYEAATNISVKYSSTGGGGGSNPHKFDKVAEYGSRITEAVQILAERNTELLDAINTLDDVTQRRIMIKRYVRMQSWDTIAEDMNYSRRHITRLHGIALANIRIPE